MGYKSGRRWRFSSGDSTLKIHVYAVKSHHGGRHKFLPRVNPTPFRSPPRLALQISSRNVMTRLRSRNRVTRSGERTFMIPFVPHHAWRARLPFHASAPTRTRAHIYCTRMCIDRQSSMCIVDAQSLRSGLGLRVYIQGVSRNSSHGCSIAIICRKSEPPKQNFSLSRGNSRLVYIYFFNWTRPSEKFATRTPTVKRWAR